MKLTVASFILFSASLPTFADTVVNFDSLTLTDTGAGYGLALLGNQLQAQGIVGSNLLVTNNLGGPLQAINVPSLPNYVEGIGTSPGTISFVTPTGAAATTTSVTVSFLGLFGSAPNTSGGRDYTLLDAGTLAVYDLLGNLLQPVYTRIAQTNQGCNNVGLACVNPEVVTFTASGIHSIVFQQSTGAAILGFDNLTFAVPQPITAVPEPALGGLALVTAMGLIALKRRCGAAIR